MPSLDFNTANLSAITDCIYPLVLKGETNIDIALTDIEAMCDTDFETYEKELLKLSDIIADLYINKKINLAINVLTDALFGDYSVIEDDFLVCDGCPCVQCVQDKELFARTTRDPYTPPRNFCRKAFIELRVAGLLKTKLGNTGDWHDIDHIDWMRLKLLQIGTMLVDDTRKEL